MSSKSILVVSDLALAHAGVFTTGLALARRHGARLHVLHPVPTDYPVSFHSTERIRVFDALRRQAEEAGVETNTVWGQGEPGEIATEYADARSVDLIIVGSERRTGLRRLRARTVAERVCALAKQPTLVLPASHGDGASTFERVVVAVDRVPRSGALVTRATEILGAPVEALTVVHAIDSLAAPHAVHAPVRWLVPEFRDHVVTEVRRELDASLEPHLDRTVQTQVIATAGPAFDTILSVARANHADVIAVGSSGRRLRAMSVTSRLVRRAEHPLLVIPDGPVWNNASHLRPARKRVA